MHPRSRAFIALAVALLLWASSYAGIRAALAAYTPGHLALLRFLSASAALGVYGLRTRMRLPARADLPGILAIGLLFALHHVGLNFGEETVTAGAASFLVNTIPVFTAILAAAMLGERPGPLGWVGITVSFGGVLLIALSEAGGFRFERGALVILLAAIAQAVCYVLQKPYLTRYRALEVTAWSVWTATLFLLVFAPGLPASLRAAPPGPTLAAVFLGIFCTAVAYLAYTYVLSQLPASAAASFLNLLPVLAIPVAWFWIGEVPRPLAILGGAVSLAGVLLVTRRGAPRGRRSPARNTGRVVRVHGG